MRRGASAEESVGEQRILILTSSMGAGHDGVSRELAKRLGARGFDCHVMDMVRVLPWGGGRLLRIFYAAVIRWVPWLYEGIYRAWLEPPPRKGATMSPVTMLLERRIARWVDENHPVAVVSTFSVTSQAAGNMREKGRLAVPVVNVIVDFSAHGAWVPSGIDAHLCLHESSAEQVHRHLATATSRVIVTGPTVREEFRDGRWDPPDGRASIGIHGEDPVVLVVGGSWGAGDLVGNVRAVLGTADLVPLVVCGNNPRLLRRITRLCSREGRGLVFGWVDDMWRFMAAADVLVENAGGLTAMEAAAYGLPVVSYRPIPGHGLRNVEGMARAGVSVYARDKNELSDALSRLSVHDGLRDHQVIAAAALFRGDAADEIARIVEDSTRV